MAVLLILGGVILLPLGFLIANSFNVASPGRPFTPGVAGWVDAFSNPKTLRAIGYSFLLSIRSLIAVVVGFAISWLLVRARIPARSFIEFSLWLAFFLPPLPITLGWILLLDPSYGLINELAKRLFFLESGPFNVYSVPGILWVHLTLTTIPFMTLLLAPALRQFDASIEESARVCGSSPLEIIRRITLPLLIPVILTVLIATLIRTLEAFEIEQLLGTRVGIDVYGTRIYDLIRWDPPNFPEAVALSTLFLAILLALALFYQRHTAGRQFVTLTGRGVSFRPINIGRWQYVASGLCLALIVVGVFLPLAMLIVGSFMNLFGFFSLAAPFSAKHWVSVLWDADFLGSLWNSLQIGLGVGIVGVGIYSLLGYAVVRSRLPGRQVIGILAWLPWAIPGILLGVALLWLLLATPAARILYGTVWALILALVIKEMPLGTHMSKTSFLQVSPELEQASRVAGANWLTTYRRITLPLITPMLVSIFVLVFIATLRDISTTILLATASTRPLSVLMMEYSNQGSLEAASVIGVVISVIAILVALAARRFGLRRMGYESA